MKTKRRKISAAVIAFSLLAAVFLPCFTELSTSAATYREPYAQYVFNGNLNDSKGNSHLTAWSSANSDNRSNSSTSFGTDSNGSYWQWHSSTARGGGFYIDFDKNIGSEYTIGIKFSFENTKGGWRKIIDYLNSAADTGFYFYNEGHLNFYDYKVNGTSVTENNQVIDLIVRRNGTTGQFEAYIVNNGTVGTADMSITDSQNQGVPAVVANGGSRLGFFFDDLATGSEASPGGKVYNLKIWDRYLDPQDVVDALLPKGYVNVKYLDEEGLSIIPDVKNSGDVDSKYEFTAPDFYGYEFVNAVGDPTSGVYPESDEYNITFNYNCLIPYTVTARYVDEDGNKLCEDILYKGEDGRPYILNQLIIDDYTFVRTEGNITGTYVKKPQLVTFVYKKNEAPPSDEEGLVNASYFDDAGNEIIESITYKGYVGGDYKTAQLYIPGYRFESLEGSETGEYKTTLTEVKYIYTKTDAADPSPDDAGGSVIIHYKDKNGYTLRADSIINGKKGDLYTAEKKDIAKYKYQSTVGNETGTIDNSIQTVTMIYDPLASDVVVRYVDDRDIEIEPTRIISGTFGSPYSTEKRDIPHYRLIRVEGEETGVFSEDVHVVKYIYKRLGQVEIQYLDINDAVIKDSELYTDYVNTEYSFTSPEIFGYEFIRAEGTESGRYTNEKQILRYIYQKIIVGTVTAHYVDEDGCKIIEDKTKWGKADTPYEFTAPDFYGYEYIKTEGDPKGVYTEGEHEISFIYKLTMPYTVTARYVDTDGSRLCEDIIYKAPENRDYKTQKLLFSGYEFVEVAGEESGKITRKPILVTYVYKKQETPPPVQYGEVTAIYQDEDGQTLHSAMNYKGVLGTAYKTSPLTIPHYELKEIVGTESDIYTADKRVITYIYTPKDTEEPIGGSVIIKYQDETGITLRPDEMINGFIGGEYHAVRYSIAGYKYTRTEGAFYDDMPFLARFSEMPGEDPENGEIEEKIKTIILYYEASQEKSASTVMAHYIDVEGNTLHFDTIYNGFIGDVYTTEAAAIDGWMLFEVNGVENGKFTDALQTVTYIYKKAGKVIVKVLDEDGNVLEEKAVIGFVGEDYDLDTINIENIDGYEPIVISAADKTGKFIDGTTEIILKVRKLKTPSDDESQPPSDSGNNGNESNESGSIGGIDVETGDNSKPYLFAMTAIMIVSAACLFLFRHKKQAIAEK